MIERKFIDAPCPEDYAWLSTSEARDAWKQLILEGGTHGLSSMLLGDKRELLRKRFLLETQLGLLRPSKEKFLHPENWFWTRKLLEQSSDEWCAHETACDLPSGIPIFDLCSGAGADAIAMAKQGHVVTSFDIDPISCALLNANAISNEVTIEGKQQAAESAPCSREVFLHVDPDRRASGTRVTSVDDFLPSWSCIEAMISQSAGVSLKVAPATRWGDKAIEPPHVIRFLSRNRSVRQQRWIWRQSRWPMNSLVVSAFHHQQWHHETFQQQELLDALPVSHQNAAGDFIADYDPAVRAAGVSQLLAARLGCSLLHANGYITNAIPVSHPMIRWFRVVEQLSMDRKKLVAFSRKTPARIWELKSRGVEFPLDTLRKQLVTSEESNRSLAILFTKVDGKNQAIVAEPLG